MLPVPALRVLRQRIELAAAFKDGRLDLGFGDGDALRVAADDVWSHTLVTIANGPKLPVSPLSRLS